MKKLSTMGVALLAIVLASSCGSSKNALQTSALEGEWNIITVNGKEATADKDVFIGLNLKENRVYGCAGCNRIMGAIQVDKDKAGHLSFGQVASTRMLCSDMATERAVLEALENVTGYKGTGTDPDRRQRQRPVHTEQTSRRHFGFLERQMECHEGLRRSGRRYRKDGENTVP